MFTILLFLVTLSIPSHFGVVNASKSDTFTSRIVRACSLVTLATISPVEFSDIKCGLHCNAVDTCAAFANTNGECTLYQVTPFREQHANCSVSMTAMVDKTIGYTTCPSSYNLTYSGIPNSRYKIYSNSVTPPVADETCTTDGGKLAEASTTGELNWFINQAVTGHILVGGYQLPGSVEPAGGWIWMNSKDSIDMTFFAPGDPNNGHNFESYCYVLNSFGLRDGGIRNTSKYPFFCECVIL